MSADNVCYPCATTLGNVPDAFLDKPIELPSVPVPGLTCGSLQSFLPTLLTADDEECEIVQRLAGVYCGCPRATNACTGLCSSLSFDFDATNYVPAFVVDNGNGASYAVRCYLVDSYLQSFVVDDGNNQTCSAPVNATELARWQQACSCSSSTSEETTDTTNNGDDKDNNGSQQPATQPPSSSLSNRGCPLCPSGDRVRLPDKDLLPFLQQALDMGTEFSQDLQGLNLTSITCATVDVLLQAAAVPSLCGTDEYLHLAGMCGCPPTHGDYCVFCPTNDITKPNELFRNIGFRSGYVTTCEQVALGVTQFATDSQYCWTAREAAFQCGCNNGTKWYLGASTDLRHAVLAWVPRVSGFLSMIGSAYILRDVYRSHRRNPRLVKTYHWLVLGMSIFDISSSLAWMFSTWPIPKEDDDRGASGVYGAQGNEATCKAQGFFLQLGFVGSTAFNASLTIFFVLSIVWNCPDTKLHKLRIWLLGVPTLLALALASAGIPYYDYLNVVCHFPNPFMQEDVVGVWRHFIILAVLPICTATLICFINLVSICYFVWKRGRAAHRWRFTTATNTTRTFSPSNPRFTNETDRPNQNTSSQPTGTSVNDDSVSQPRRKLSRAEAMVFWQAFWYVIAFFLTWAAYLVGMFRPYLTTNDDGLFAFWVIVLVLNPLMGFWNAIVYAKPWTWERKQRQPSTQLQSLHSQPNERWKRCFCCHGKDVENVTNQETDPSETSGPKKSMPSTTSRASFLEGHEERGVPRDEEFVAADTLSSLNPLK